MSAQPLFRSYRGIILALLSLTVYVWVSERANLGFGIVCMVNSSALVSDFAPNSSIPQQCKARLDSVDDIPTNMGYHGELTWTKSEQANLFSALFYGSLLTVGFSGTIADSFDPKMLILVAITFYTILTLVTPLLVENYVVYLIARFLMGLADGLIFPATSSMVARWFPQDERSTVSAIYTSGNQLANSFNVLLAGKLCSLDFLNGWPLIFIIWGAFGLIYILFFLLFASNSPNENRFISEKEKVYLNIQLSTQHNGLATRKLSSAKSIPWIAMLTSPATIAVVLSQFSFNYINSFWQTFLPSYFRDVLLLDLSKNGLFSAAPFFFQLICKLFMGFGSDALKRKGIMSETTSCKILQSLATFGTALCFVLLALFVDCTNPMLGFILFGIMGCVFAGQIAGAFTASLAIAPSYTGTITSLSSFVGGLANVAVPTTIGLFNKHGTREEWNVIFYIAAGVSFFTGLFFLIFGTAEIQEWARVSKPQVVSIQSISLPNLKQEDDHQKSNV
ncbi:MFS domain-containing protein [Aphelenchoides bicaudatus]|nr:MFS domain-containing protein [Aphelenchoides bicaudatus]